MGPPTCRRRPGARRRSAYRPRHLFCATQPSHIAIAAITVRTPACDGRTGVQPGGRPGVRMDDQATPHTYQQAAEALGIEAKAVRARLRRGALRRGPLTNDRRPTVLLSPAEIEAIRAGIRMERPESDP